MPQSSGPGFAYLVRLNQVEVKVYIRTDLLAR